MAFKCMFIKNKKNNNLLFHQNKGTERGNQDISRRKSHALLLFYTIQSEEIGHLKSLQKIIHGYITPNDNISILIECLFLACINYALKVEKFEKHTINMF